MSRYSVVFTPEAEQQIAELYRYVAVKASPETARRFTTKLVDYCAGLNQFPHKGTRRDDIRPGLRTLNYRGKTIIAIAVDDVARVVTIVGIFYGGRNYEVLLGAKDGESS